MVGDGIDDIVVSVSVPRSGRDVDDEFSMADGEDFEAVVVDVGFDTDAVSFRAIGIDVDVAVDDEFAMAGGVDVKAVVLGVGFDTGAVSLLAVEIDVDVLVDKDILSFDSGVNPVS